jgi:HNH endonuclease
LPQDNFHHNRLLQAIKQTPTKEWVEQYLDLIKDLLEFTGLTENDPRLSVSTTKNYGIAINVNFRQVLTSFHKGNSWTGFLFSHDFEDLAEIAAQASISSQFKPRLEEVPGETPHILRFDGLPKNVLTSNQNKAWERAVLIELKHGKSSPYKKYHNPAAYKAVGDLKYRALVIQEAFSESQQYKQKKRFDLSNQYQLSELNNQRQRIEEEGYFKTDNLEDARQRVTASIVQRQGQSEFRRNLLDAYCGRCAITGCDVEPAIEAAHIIPYQGTSTNHSTNGLPLRADIHTLFDLHLLSIRPDIYEVVIAPQLMGTCYQELAQQKLTMPQSHAAVPSQEALKKHHAIFLEKHENL